MSAEEAVGLDCLVVRYPPRNDESIPGMMQTLLAVHNPRSLIEVSDFEMALNTFLSPCHWLLFMLNYLGE